MDIANGDGIGVAVFFSGCDANPKCKECFNSDIWDENCGQPYTTSVKWKILKMLDNPHIDHLSILGGDPMTDYNIQAVGGLVRAVKEIHPDKKIWLWTWRMFEQLKIDKDRKIILPYIDILVDGRFIEAEKDLSLPYCGSRNQRVIDVQKTLINGEIVLYNP